jgi:hypothetical protein
LNTMTSILENGMKIKCVEYQRLNILMEAAVGVRSNMINLKLTEYTNIKKEEKTTNN